LKEQLGCSCFAYVTADLSHLHLVPNVWSYTSTHQYAFMAWVSVKAQGQLYLYLYHRIFDLPPSEVIRKH